MLKSIPSFWKRILSRHRQARALSPLGRHRRVFLEALEERRVLAPGDLDQAFGGGDGIVTTAIGARHDTGNSVAVDGAGNYVVAGRSHYGSNYDFALTRYTPGGALDLSFGGGDGIVTTDIGAGTDEGQCVAVDGAGRYVVAGN